MTLKENKYINQPQLTSYGHSVPRNFEKALGLFQKSLEQSQIRNVHAPAKLVLFIAGRNGKKEYDILKAASDPHFMEKSGALVRCCSSCYTLERENPIYLIDFLPFYISLIDKYVPYL